MLTILTVLLQATNLTSKYNDILSKYALPSVMFLVLGSAVLGIILNLDKIVDSDGRGTRKEGYMNVAYIIGGVIISVAVIAGIVSLVGEIDLSI